MHKPLTLLQLRAWQLWWAFQTPDSSPLQRGRRRVLSRYRLSLALFDSGYYAGRQEPSLLSSRSMREGTLHGTLTRASKPWSFCTYNN